LKVKVKCHQNLITSRRHHNKCFYRVTSISRE